CKLPTGKSRSSSICTSVSPTVPVAPITAISKDWLMVLPLAKRGERHFTGWVACRQFGLGLRRLFRPLREQARLCLGLGINPGVRGVDGKHLINVRLPG